MSMVVGGRQWSKIGVVRTVCGLEEHVRLAGHERELPQHNRFQLLTRAFRLRSRATTSLTGQIIHWKQVAVSPWMCESQETIGPRWRAYLLSGCAIQPL